MSFIDQKFPFATVSTKNKWQNFSLWFVRVQNRDDPELCTRALDLFHGCLTKLEKIIPHSISCDQWFPTTRNVNSNYTSPNTRRIDLFTVPDENWGLKTSRPPFIQSSPQFGASLVRSNPVYKLGTCIDTPWDYDLSNHWVNSPHNAWHHKPTSRVFFSC